MHTHLLGEKLTQDDLTDLALLRLDLMSIVQVDRKDGLPGMVYSRTCCRCQNPCVSRGHERDRVQRRTPTQQAVLTRRTSFSNRIFPRISIPTSATLIESLEDEMARVRLTARTRHTGRDRAILVGVTTGDADDADESLAELEGTCRLGRRRRPG